MYLRWAERHQFHTEIVDQQEGEQAGLKSVTVEVNGRAAYGWLRVERGVHRLVRISPFDSQKRRQTTFALVEVLPEADDDIEIELDWDEIRVDTFRSQGAGGQHVNKTDSAVRLTHLPTGIVAQSQNERSQTQNKETAIKVLKSRMLERALEEKEAELRKLRGEHVEAGWGNQIRSYVLHPYQMVKDLRTNHETGNTAAVLDGDLDAFMQAELERLATGGQSARGDDDRRGRHRRRRGRLRVALRDAPSAALANPSFRPATGRRPADVRRDLAQPRSTTTRIASTSPRSPTTWPRSSASTATSGRPTRTRFVVAERAEESGETRIVGFVAALRRDALWFLSMLFVLPAMQGGGLGRALLDRVLPANGAATLATCTDSAQPISNALYASLGMVPRMPLLRLVGLPDRPEALATLPRRHPRRSLRRGRRRGGTGLGGAALDDELAALDRDAAGFEHREDHAFVARRSSGSDSSIVGRDGAARRLRLRVGGRTGRSGRSPGSGAPRADPRPPRHDRPAAWGVRRLDTGRGDDRDDARSCAPDSGSMASPACVCWDRPLTDFSRYVPISPGLLT